MYIYSYMGNLLKKVHKQKTTIKANMAVYKGYICTGSYFVSNSSTIIY